MINVQLKDDSKPDLVNTKKHHDMYISIFIPQLCDFEYYACAFAHHNKPNAIDGLNY
jgi:hypothetical protein